MSVPRRLLSLRCPSCDRRTDCRRVRGTFRGVVQLLDGSYTPDGSLEIATLPKTEGGWLAVFPCNRHRSSTPTERTQ